MLADHCVHRREGDKCFATPDPLHLLSLETVSPEPERGMDTPILTAMHKCPNGGLFACQTRVCCEIGAIAGEADMSNNLRVYASQNGGLRL